MDGAEVELVKESDKEKIKISFNVNHTVDADEEAELETQSDKQDFAEMKSRPTFEVDLIRKGTTLSFTCSFLNGPGQEGEGEAEGFSEFVCVCE